jgi:hypothetical protein
MGAARRPALVCEPPPWIFRKLVQGRIVFACQMPGHHEGGMQHQAKLEKVRKARTS